MNSKQDEGTGQAGKARLRHGGYAALVTILVLASLVLANLVVGLVPAKLDLSSLGLYSLSPQTLGILRGLDEDVTIYGLFKPGQEPSNVVEALRRYRDASPRVRLELLDLERNPSFAKRYDRDGQGLSPGSLVVVAATSGRFKVIPYIDLYSMGANRETGEREVQGVAIEQRVTGAIVYAAGARSLVAYELTGHSEFPVKELGLESELADDNIDLGQLNLLSAGAVPGDADLVLVISPKSDLLPSEAEALKRFLDSGGSAVFLIDRMRESLGNLEGVINLNGVATTQGYVLEGDQSSMVAGRPNLLIPDYGSHPVLDSLREKSYVVTLLNSQGLVESGLRKRNLAVTPLLVSSGKSWLRTDLGSDSMGRIPGDQDGPFALAYAVEERKEDPAAKRARLVVMGSSLFVMPAAMAQYMGPGNKELLLNMVGWSASRGDGLGIRPKSAYRMPTRLDAAQSALWMAAIVVVLPGLVLGAGLVVWLRRRHR